MVIDTLQKIRHRVGDVGYNADYEDLGALKRYADEHGIAILLLHHTRKAEAETEYDRISGTTGITGVADTMMVLTRKGNEATLLVKGREFEEQEIPIVFCDGDWKRIDESVLRERAYEALPDSVKATIALMNDCSSWQGTYKDLLDTIDVPDMTERALSQQLRDHLDTLKASSIDFSWTRKARGTVITLTKQ